MGYESVRVYPSCLRSPGKEIRVAQCNPRDAEASASLCTVGKTGSGLEHGLATFVHTELVLHYIQLET
jgi:hypothetical protein